jgi:hypothetical protein
VKTVTDIPEITIETSIKPVIENKVVKNLPKYGVEFFHIYTDEKISPVHEASLHFLEQARQAWSFDHELILLVDNYNPEEQLLKTETVLSYLSEQGCTPSFWAYEADMVANARILLDNITKPKLKKNYERYIEQHGKYPCSLLTATWYLTRLGALPYESVIKSTSETPYKPVDRLINILPEDYKSVEQRAEELIEHSTFSAYSQKTQDLFFPMKSGREISLW